MALPASLGTIAAWTVRIAGKPMGPPTAKHGLGETELVLADRLYIVVHGSATKTVYTRLTRRTSRRRKRDCCRGGKTRANCAPDHGQEAKMRVRARFPRLEPDVMQPPMVCPCQDCQGEYLKMHEQRCAKPLRDTKFERVVACRRKCLACRRTHRVYPQGVGEAQQSGRIQGLHVTPSQLLEDLALLQWIMLGHPNNSLPLLAQRYDRYTVLADGKCGQAPAPRRGTRATI
jgi:hypothetical protein